MPSIPFSDSISSIYPKIKLKKSSIFDDIQTQKTLISAQKGKKDKRKSEESNGMSKKVKVMDAEDEEEEEDPNSLSKFQISKPIKDKLISKGIKSLFPIQALSFDFVLNGGDLIGRARTGQGKTLAFVLPILESLVNGPAKALRKSGFGKSPSVLVLLPTRELANQVYAEFQFYGGAVGLQSCCVYGGASIQSQMNSVKKGVDIVIGTPGRVKDLLDRGVLNLGSLLFRVLDEADEMLNMGFVEEVELILGKVDDVKKVQTLLFSATLAGRVQKVCYKFLKSDKKQIDLVEDEEIKASTNVRHIVMPCSFSAMPELIPDIIRCYSSGGSTIIFTEQRESASQLASSLPGARPIHGDIQQSQREVTLSGFRAGKFTTLVATNVLARGLDIDGVQLIIQCEPPKDVEAYIHRSGRTGRAGKTGVAVMLFDPKKSNFSRIERESGLTFEHLSAPQPIEVAEAAGVEAAASISQICDSVIPAFKKSAEELLSTSGLSPVDLVAKLLAKSAGYSDIKERSLLTSLEGYVTLFLEASKPFFTPSPVFGILRRFLSEENVASVQGMAITADHKGAVFDVPLKCLNTFLAAGQKNPEQLSVEVIKVLPAFQERDSSRGKFGNSRGGGGFSRGGGGSGGPRFGGRGGRSNGFSDRKSNGFSRGRGRG